MVSKAAYSIKIVNSMTFGQLGSSASAWPCYSYSENASLLSKSSSLLQGIDKTN